MLCFDLLAFRLRDLPCNYVGIDLPNYFADLFVIFQGFAIRHIAADQRFDAQRLPNIPGSQSHPLVDSGEIRISKPPME
ncbi:MAG: hypothetical protein IJP03_02400, partial [Christensenellaceae bacterium]|nr:hypothetical protein [Christensenellaceae bacterium]